MPIQNKILFMSFHDQISNYLLFICQNRKEHNITGIVGKNKDLQHIKLVGKS